MKLLGKNIGFINLRNQINSMWQLMQPLEPIDLGNGFFIVRFTCKDDYEKVLQGGPWMILGHYLTVQKWKPNFKASTASVTSTSVWVRFPETSVECFNEEILTWLGGAIGKVVKMDKHTTESIRGRFRTSLCGN